MSPTVAPLPPAGPLPDPAAAAVAEKATADATTAGARAVAKAGKAAEAAEKRANRTLDQQLAIDTKMQKLRDAMYAKRAARFDQ